MAVLNKRQNKRQGVGRVSLYNSIYESVWFIVGVLNKRQNKRQGVEGVSIYNSIYKFIYCGCKLFGSFVLNNWVQQTQNTNYIKMYRRIYRYRYI